MLADLIELMMIQNAQMHQVIMNNLTMSALTSFGLSPAPPTAQVRLSNWGGDIDQKLNKAGGS